LLIRKDRGYVALEIGQDLVKRIDKLQQQLEQMQETLATKEDLDKMKNSLTITAAAAWSLAPSSSSRRNNRKK